MSATHVYRGDESTYGVAIVRSASRGARTVRVLSVISGPGSIPIGATVTVPSRRIALAPKEN